MKRISWEFPLLGSGPVQGYTNNDIEAFKGEELMDNLAREICQNSLDAHDPEAKPYVKVVFELKRRNFSSSKYGDSSIEASKFVKLEKDKRDGSIYDGFVVSFFSDIYTIDSIGEGYNIRSVNCAKTTEFTDQTKEDKLLICFPQNKKFNY